MKLSPKHFRLLSIMNERGSVPARIMPGVREELVAFGLAEYFHGGVNIREKERYRPTDQGHKLIDDNNNKQNFYKLHTLSKTEFHDPEKRTNKNNGKP